MDFADLIWGRTVALESIGPGIKYLGPKHWQVRMMFSGVPDIYLRQLTKEFPQKLKGRGLRHTHPIFVIESYPNLSHRVCPCSSKLFQGSHKYISAGCILEYTQYQMTKTSYIVEKHSFHIPEDAEWLDTARFMGRVPEKCIKLLS